MNLVNLQVELQWLRPLLERLVFAVERIAGPIPVESKVRPRISGLEDYAYIPPDELARVQYEQEIFALRQMVVPGSQAYIDGVSLYEKQIIDSYGEVEGARIIAKLPWKVARINPNGEKGSSSDSGIC